MAKNFELEKRAVFDNPYLKLYLRNGLDYTSIAKHLEALYSVRKVNITQQNNNKQDLTIYPEKAYDISETEQEIKLTLTSYFNVSPIDPVFITETISSISNKAYFQIIDYIITLGKNLETFKELNTKFDEERYRDYFIAFLNSVSPNHAAKGEVFNRKGKTDILVFDNHGNNIFIGECKLWKGEAYLTNAINQLLENYVNWRDEKTAILVFNRDVQKFTDLIDKATNTITNHPLCIKSMGVRNGTSYSYLFMHPDDADKLIKLELVLFNFV